MPWLDTALDFITQPEVIGAGVGMLAGGLGANTNQTQTTTTNTLDPRMSPYLFGEAGVPSWATARPTVSDAFDKWNQKLLQDPGRNRTGFYEYTPGPQMFGSTFDQLSPPTYLEGTRNPILEAADTLGMSSFGSGVLNGGEGRGEDFIGEYAPDWNEMDIADKEDAINAMNILGMFSPGLFGMALSNVDIGFLDALANLGAGLGFNSFAPEEGDWGYGPTGGWGTAGIGGHEGDFGGMGGDSMGGGSSSDADGAEGAASPGGEPGDDF